MNEEWKNFLLQQETTASQSQNKNCLSDLSHLDIMEISGDDSQSFLQGQLSSDLSTLKSGDWQLSSWCNIKGRVIATFLVYRATDRYFILLENTISQKLSKRLQMFVLRANVSITNRSNDLVPVGLTGPLGQETQSYLDEKENMHVLDLETAPETARSIIICPVTEAMENS